MIFQDTFLLIYCTALAVIIGAVSGSFLNCTAWRIAHHESFIRGRSHCPTCGHELGAADLIPIISWLALRGRCRYCKSKVSARYVLAEVFMAIVAVSALHRLDLTAECGRTYLFCCILFLASMVDLEIYEIPDGCHIAAILNWIAWMPLVCGGDWINYILHGLSGGVIIGGGVLIISLIMDKVLGKESLGGGDVKLLFVCGLYLGLVPSLFMLILACIAGLAMVVLKKESRIPFGPSIALATWVMLLYGQQFADWYLSLL